MDNTTLQAVRLILKSRQKEILDITLETPGTARVIREGTAKILDTTFNLLIQDVENLMEVRTS